MQDPYHCWCTISVLARESGFLKKYKGRGLVKVCLQELRYAWKAIKNVRAELGQAGRSIRIFFKMTAENPMLRPSHCDQIY